MHEEEKNFKNEGWAKKKKEIAEEEAATVEESVEATATVAVTTKLTIATSVAAINRDTTWNTDCATIVR